MISFAPTDEQLAAREVLEALSRDVLRPTARDNDREGRICAKALSALENTGLIEAALFEDGEARPSYVSGAIALEAIAYADASLAVAIAAPLGFARAVMQHGSAAQRERLVSNWSRPGFKSAAVLIQEPGFFFDVTKPKTRVRREGQRLILSGAKAYAPRAVACSDFLVVAADESGVGAYLVAADAPGVVIREPDGTLGLKSAGLADVRFDNVALGEGARLGSDADVDVRVLIAAARTAASAIMTGVCGAVLDYLTPYLRQRVAHGSALAQKQSVAFRLADMTIDIPSMRWMTWRAAAGLDASGEATRNARLAHIHCVEQALWITDEGVQLMGGHGYMRDHPVERWYRDVRTLSQIEGMVGL
jgi:alkylation response protein AidB-like acyl-CoA dehydrogenase